MLAEKIGVIVDPDSPADDTPLQSVANHTGATVVAGMIHVPRVYTPRFPVLKYHNEYRPPPFESKCNPASTLTLVSHPSGIWGVVICKDMDFTGLSRRYGNAGVRLVLVPAWDFNVDWI